MAGERSQNVSNETECYFSRIPVEIVEKIISYLSPYGDFYNAKIVCRMWYGLISRICEQRVQNFNEAVKTGHLRIRTMSTKSRISPLPRFSHGSCIVGERMYIFGGCSSSNTAFNDLYCLNLRERRWIKPLTAGNPPPPRECATLVVHDNKDILIFGGWCQPARVGINSMAKFFDDLYIFSILTSSWKSPVVNEVERPRPCKRAGHGACVLGHKMVIFGGAQRELRFNDVWVLDMTQMTWSCPNIRGKKPSGRFGHSQIAVDNQTVLVLGGCGGPNLLFGDVWILDTTNWIWQELVVKNRHWEAPQLWCHPAVRVDDTVVVFSVPCHQGHTLSPENQRATGLDGFLPMQAFILDCSQIRSHFFCSWKPPALTVGSPPATSLHSVVVARGEILIFGGIFTRWSESTPQTSANLVAICSAT